MREIKFRGKSLISGEYIYGYYYNMDDNRKGNRRHIIVCQSKEAGLQTIHEPVYAETVGQYTDLKDKNGTEIYEGDILLWKCSKSGSDKVGLYVARIIWGDGRYDLTVYDNGQRWATNKSFWNNNDREVIGNIYENPELLEV